MADLVITAADVDPGDNANRAQGIANETITAGQAIRIDVADPGKIALAINTTAVKAKVDGIALNGASSNQPIDYIRSGDLDLGVVLTVGEIYALSATNGGIRPATDNVSGDFVTVLGVADATDNLKTRIIVSGVAVP